MEEKLAISICPWMRSERREPDSSAFGLTKIAANVEAEAIGKGGNLVIESDRLRITDGAQVSTGSFGLADSGKLTVRAKDIEVIGISPVGQSGLFTATAQTGQGGNLTIESDRLRVTDGALLATGKHKDS